MSRIIHQVGHCQDCDVSWDDYKNGTAKKQAIAHAKKTGHRVFGETATCWNFHYPKKSS